MLAARLAFPAMHRAGLAFAWGLSSCAGFVGSAVANLVIGAPLMTAEMEAIVGSLVAAPIPLTVFGLLFHGRRKR